MGKGAPLDRTLCLPPLSVPTRATLWVYAVNGDRPDSTDAGGQALSWAAAQAPHAHRLPRPSAEQVGTQLLQGRISPPLFTRTMTGVVPGDMGEKACISSGSK